MLEKIGRIRLLYIVLAVLLVVGLLPLAFAGTLLSGRSAEELRSVEGRYQAQLVQDKARQIELYGQRYRDVVTGLARAFEIASNARIGVYDCLYVALAEREKAPLITADQRLLGLQGFPLLDLASF